MLWKCFVYSYYVLPENIQALITEGIGNSGGGSNFSGVRGLKTKINFQRTYTVQRLFLTHFCGLLWCFHWSCCIFPTMLWLKKQLFKQKLFQSKLASTKAEDIVSSWPVGCHCSLPVSTDYYKQERLPVVMLNFWCTVQQRNKKPIIKWQHNLNTSKLWPICSYERNCV